MLIKSSSDIKASEITPEKDYLNRRAFMKGAAAGLAYLALPESSYASGKLNSQRNPVFSTKEPLTKFKDATRYNNFYEFGTDKSDPSQNAHTLITKPWSIEVSGHCKKPGKYALEDVINFSALEERVYRLRCVEAWSMVIPWAGVGLGEVLKKYEPTSKAKFVEFRTLYDPKQMPAQNYKTLDWPYREGLRMDEAMHPLAILSVGMYGKVMPNQNGAPVRLVVPWKYGFKSIKSIVRIHFTETQPITTWETMSPEEYGFYSNVNPARSHPRWSQKRERRIGDWLKRETLPFNGYADQVTSLYSGMDLIKYY